MGYYLGYASRRSNVIIPSEQKKLIHDFGAATVHDDLDETLDCLREGDVLVVYSIAILGRVHFHKAFLAVANAKGKGIYSLKSKKLYPAKLPDAELQKDAYDEIQAVERRNAAKMGKEFGGRHKGSVWSNAERIKALYADDWHIDDLAAKFKTSTPTIRRILKETNVQPVKGSDNG
tara:strand:- start:213 stop:740 length:528 start_codon:yes stop_codon:yes gene_type:complete